MKSNHTKLESQLRSDQDIDTLRERALMMLAQIRKLEDLLQREQLDWVELRVIVGSLVQYHNGKNRLAFDHTVSKCRAFLTNTK